MTAYPVVRPDLRPESDVGMSAGVDNRWALVAYRGADGERAGALRRDGRIVGLGDLGKHGTMGLLDRWVELEPELRAFEPDEREPLDGVTLDLPLRYPRKLILAGANYHSHLREMGVGSPPEDGQPFFFFKPPTTALVGPGEPIEIDGSPDAKIDWEVELGIVIGRRAARLDTDEALSVVAGYVVLNDVTDRGALLRDNPLSPHFAYDWAMSKAGDGSCPIGPGIVPAFAVDDPQSLPLRLWRNDELQQDGNTADMVHDIATVIAAASRMTTLEPGDVIATGTPSGVGVPRGQFLRPGDHVTVEVGEVGWFANPVIARSPS